MQVCENSQRYELGEKTTEGACACKNHNIGTSYLAEARGHAYLGMVKTIKTDAGKHTSQLLAWRPNDHTDLREAGFSSHVDA